MTCNYWHRQPVLNKHSSMKFSMSKTHLLNFHLTPKIGYKLNIERETRQGDHPLTWWAAFCFNFSKKLTGHIDLYFTFFANDYRLDTCSLAGDFLVKKYGRYRPTRYNRFEKFKIAFQKMPLISGRKSLSDKIKEFDFWDSYPTSKDCFRCDRLYPIDWVVSVCAKKLISPQG